LTVTDLIYDGRSTLSTHKYQGADDTEAGTVLVILYVCKHCKIRVRELELETTVCQKGVINDHH